MYINLRSIPRLKAIAVQVSFFSSKPTASEVLSAYLTQCNEPPWTSYFVKVISNIKLSKLLCKILQYSQYSSVKNDQFGMSNFNWQVGESNYQILRTGCFPYIKYHCSKRIVEDLDISDKFMRAIKIINLGIPCLLYGLAATQLIRHEEIVHTTKGPVTIYFLLPEHKGSSY